MRLLLALAAVLLTPAAAQAAGPKVTWPEQRTYAPGETLTVKVASSRAVRVALVRESASGKVMRTIARRTLRTGTFKAKPPRAGRYSLRVGARQRDVTVASAPVSSGPLPPAEPAPLCRPDGDRAELRLGATSARAGGSLPFEVVNTSSSCLTLGVGYSFERLLPDGTWAAIPSNQVFITLAVVLGPGQRYAKQAVVPADVVPGTYRVVDAAYGSGTIDLAGQFDVLP